MRLVPESYELAIKNHGAKSPPYSIDSQRCEIPFPPKKVCNYYFLLYAIVIKVLWNGNPVLFSDPVSEKMWCVTGHRTKSVTGQYSIVSLVTIKQNAWSGMSIKKERY